MAEQITMWKDAYGDLYASREDAEVSENQSAIAGAICGAVDNEKEPDAAILLRGSANHVATELARFRPDLVEPLLEVLQRPRPEGDG